MNFWTWAAVITVTCIIIGSFVLNAYFLKNKHHGLERIVREIWARLRAQLLKPRTYVGVSIIILILGHLIEHEFIFKTLDTYPDSIVSEIIRELAIFLFIAGTVGALLHSTEFKQKFAQLLYLNSDYLKNLSQENKIKFFVGTLKSAYEFSDYGLEEEFAELTTQNYIPVFEKSYKSNHYIHRKYKVFDKNSGSSGGFTVEESQGWRSHFPKGAEEKMTPVNRVFSYINFDELYKRCFTHGEIWMRKAPNHSGISLKYEKTPEHHRCVTIKTYVDARVSASEFISTMKELAEINFDNNHGELVNKLKTYFSGHESKTGLKVHVRTKDDQVFELDSPDITVCEQKKITLDYKIKEVSYANIILDLSKQSLDIEQYALLDEIIPRQDYHFVRTSKFYAYNGEGFILGCASPTKNIIVSILFEGLEADEALLADLTFLPFKGSNPMTQPTQSRTYFSQKLSGWFFMRNGVVFSYRIMRKQD